MTHASIVNEANEFPQVTVDDWRTLAMTSLKGKSLEQALAFTIDETLEVNAFASADDLAHRPEPLPSARTPGAWIIAQTVDLARTDALDIAQEELEGGCDGLRVALKPDEPSDQLNVLLALARAHNAWLCLDHPGASMDIARSLSACGVADLTGIAGLDPLGDALADAAIASDLQSHVQHMVDAASGVREKHPEMIPYLINAHRAFDAGATHVREIALCLASARMLIEAMLDDGMSADDAATSIAWSVACDADQFLTMAKGRALRLCLLEMMRAYGAGAHAPVIIMRSAERALYPIEPHINQLRATAMTAGAVLGGATAVTLLPHDHAHARSDAFSRRMARNIQTILMKESHLALVGDPAAGSYAIETMTRDIAQAAWADFQAIEANGGLGRSFSSGELTSEIAAMASARQHDVDRGRTPLTGINSYPHADTDSPTASGTGASKASTVRRPSATFERLRDAEARRSERTRIGIALLGPGKNHGARLTFIRNALAASGISPEIIDADTELSALDAVFLCGSDADYDSEAMDVWKQLNPALDCPCWMAGGSQETVAELCAAGIVRTVRATDSLADWLIELTGKEDVR